MVELAEQAQLVPGLLSPWLQDTCVQFNCRLFTMLQARNSPRIL